MRATKYAEKRRKRLRQFFPTGITRRMFLSLIAFSTVIITFSTAVFTIISSRYLSRSLLEQLDDQTQQIINIYDQQMGALSSAVLTANNQSAVKALIGGSYSGYEAYTVSRDSYNYICYVSNMNRYMNMYLFVPERNYVMGSSSGDVSSGFDISQSPNTADWYEELAVNHSMVSVRSDFIKPVSGGETCFAYIMTLYATSDWTIKGFIAATLEKDYLDGLLKDTFLEDRGFLLIMNPDGNLAYTSSPELSEKNSDIIPPADYFDGKSGMVRNTELNRYYMVSNVSELGGFRFIAFADRSALNAAVTRLIFVTLLFFCLILLIMFTGAYAISKNISRPIREMTEFIHQLEQNDFDGRLSLKAGDEIGELVRSFNAMLDSVQENQILRRQAQLNALQKQIDPHFLFNTLETVKALAIRQDTQAVCSALQSLGDMFRYNTNRDNRSVTTLRDELRHIRNYLLIQQLRFGERLCYEINAPQELMGYTTLKFILQPIVENSIRYAMESMECSYLLRITVSEKSSDILIEIADNGPGMDKDRLERLRRFIENEGEQGDFGIGMKNIAQRLRLHFSEPYGLSIDSVEDTGTTVYILFPKRRG